MTFDPYLIVYSYKYPEKSQKWIKGISKRLDQKPQEGSKGKKTSWHSQDYGSFAIKAKSQETRAKTDRWGYIKPESVQGKCWQSRKGAYEMGGTVFNQILRRS